MNDIPNSEVVTKVYVKVTGARGIQLKATHPEDTTSKVLVPGTYVFYTQPIAGIDRPPSTWALLESNPAYGIPLERLRTLDEEHGVIEATDSHGRRYF